MVYKFILFAGFLTLPTAYVTGNPVECVLHPSLWNDSGVWDAVGVGQMPMGNDDAEYEEENIGYPVSSVSYILFMLIIRNVAEGRNVNLAKFLNNFADKT